MEILGSDFKKEQFKVLKPKPPKGGDPPPPDDNAEPPEDGNPPDDSNIEEIPVKTIEDILEDLKKEGVKDPDTQDELPDYQIDDKGEEKPEDKGEEKPEDGGNENPEDKGEEKPEDGGKKTTDRQDKIKEKENKEKERRENIKTKNQITKKINSYNTFKEKYKDVLPERQKNAIDKAVSELNDLRNSIKTD